MNATLSWTIGAGATSQNVQYKLSTSSTWITFSTVGGSANTETVTGLDDNLLYNFRIVSFCSGGEPAPSAVLTKINMTCPSVTTTVTDTTISYSFNEVGGDVTSYVVKLFNSAGTAEVATSTPTGTTTLTGTITGLTASSTYKLRVIPAAGSITKADCPFVDVTTAAPPVCSIPTNVVATLEVESVELGICVINLGASMAPCIGGTADDHMEAYVELSEVTTVDAVFSLEIGYIPGSPSGICSNVNDFINLSVTVLAGTSSGLLNCDNGAPFIDSGGAFICSVTISDGPYPTCLNNVT
jgi:hypothetical protein